MKIYENKNYIVVVQCHTVKEYCPGYFCEKSFNERTGGFAALPKDKNYRIIYLTCGGCCGKAVHRKLALLLRRIKKYENTDRSGILVQLASCITKDNHHSTPCPHIDYLKILINKLNLDIALDTSISKKSEKRREAGLYKK